MGPDQPEGLRRRLIIQEGDERSRGEFVGGEEIRHQGDAEARQGRRQDAFHAGAGKRGAPEPRIGVRGEAPGLQAFRTGIAETDLRVGL